MSLESPWERSVMGSRPEREGMGEVWLPQTAAWERKLRKPLPTGSIGSSIA